MTPKEKAEEIIKKFIPVTMDFEYDKGFTENKETAKEAALIHVNGILKLSGLPQYQIIFWQQVKTEIEKL